ncbi:carbamoyl-phosphate synthase large subunit [Magnetococcus marinus MC-1]|uniref:Carbamoyl phosphate synthase large chain n=1 Tax=Magnetococcus marinus (strain ATCC BAA-1437 / JCM 17883 / MC-1) TaxID=156889 RepID=A0LC16_MAGMM|nr:carbamoyl-phosphate synthase large subunit [Magnetococcus marinus]ABK45509.1 carbamoyl-phosphate synthase large subunit [Magnetococcus marinus MC-1]
MPKRTDLKKIMLIGSGPIVIGQACEFDYSGAQACKALKEEGYEVVLVNSNPATIMTDPELADRTYVEPITLASVTRIIAKERPDAILPTMGGQTALNMALNLADAGVLEQYNVELIGASRDAISKAEDRERFKQAMDDIGLEMPKSGFAHSMEEAWEIQTEVGYPTIIRPSFTLGGTGGGIAYNSEEFEEIIRRGLAASPTTEVLVEESVLGWKEFEMEVVRDRLDNAIIVCSIENFDPMGVHTGDSITVAPAQTLTDKEYQILRDVSIAVLREIGVDTGGSNVQFAIHPENGRLVVIEMNPRVSRSSALASKATGFPIAKVAAKLAIGYTLPEIMNDITGVTPASFEPTIDYVVTKIPRFTFEKFPQASALLTTQMKSVGEAMAIGRTFKESLQKALRSMEIGLDGFGEILDVADESWEAVLEERLHNPGPDRILYVAEAFRQGKDLEWLNRVTAIDPWFLDQIQQIVEAEASIRGVSFENISIPRLRELKEMGFSDARLARLTQTSDTAVRTSRLTHGVVPVFKRVDTCGAEFASQTAYLYATYEQVCEAAPSSRKKIMILGGGPNRIGQGIEFDYCCVHAAFALRDVDYETIMVNCNPETVSTDYDTSDRLYFEPLTFEDVMTIVDIEKPDGVIVQFGGQTPLKLAKRLEAAGVPIIGTTPEAIDVAEDRERFQVLLQKLGLRQPPNGIARSEQEAIREAEAIGFPVVVRPSYVLGGRAMEIVHDVKDLERYMRTAVQASPDHPVLIDHFLRDAIEIDVDCIADGKTAVVAGIMEHIEEAGVHSGDSACSLPPYSVGLDLINEIERQTKMLAAALEVKGLMNIQFAIQKGAVYILEVNPRASRTVPFVSKATGVPFAKLAARVMAGESLQELGLTHSPKLGHVAVKEAVFPFEKFMNVDPVLGPEMKSTGEVMGLADTFGAAFAKAQEGAGVYLPMAGKCANQRIFISVKDEDKHAIVMPAKRLVEMGYKLSATSGTARFLEGEGVPVETVNKVTEGRPHIVDQMKSNEVALVFNTTQDKRALEDSFPIRRTALMSKIPYFTTVAGMRAAVSAMEAMRAGDFSCKALQDYY